MSAAPCGCCDCLRGLTPLDLANRSGLSALRYRAGTHSSFLETMLADLSGVAVPSIHGLTTRETSDPSIALLDAWATVGDVLTFYQERIANEGYLRTATERRSLVELGRLVGYELRPGVAASVHLAYTMDDGATTEIPAGARSQSVPAPGETTKPQPFEISEPLKASHEWNILRPRQSRRRLITLHEGELVPIILPQNDRIATRKLAFSTTLEVGTVFTIEQIELTGTATNLKTQDSLLFVFGDGPVDQVLRVVKSVELDHERNRTVVTLQRIPMLLIFFRVVVVKKLVEFSTELDAKDQLTALFMIILADALRWIHVAGGSSTEDDVREKIESVNEELSKYPLILTQTVPPPGQGAVLELENILLANTDDPVKDNTTPTFALKDLLDALLVERSEQPLTSHHLPQDLASIDRQTSKARIQLLQAVVPRLRERYAAAIKNAVLEPESPPLRDLFVLRDVGAPFGFNAPKITVPNTTIPFDNQPNGFPGVNTVPQDPEVENEDLARTSQLHLDRIYDRVMPEGWIVIRSPRIAPIDLAAVGLQHLVERAFALRVLAINTVAHSLYGMSGKISRLALSEPWLAFQANVLIFEGNPFDFRRFRGMTILLQSERLELAEQLIEDDVFGAEIVLDRYYDGLVAGRWILVSGERADIPGTTGVIEREVVMIADVAQRQEHGGTAHTVLFLARKGLAYRYRRTTVLIYGNVAPATHGELQEHAVGSGDASLSLQTMKLRSAPLTFVPATTPAGVASTLRVRVNDVLWLENDSFLGLGPTSHAYITKTSEDAQTTIVFGNGRDGARLPTGNENVRAAYRVGLGRIGNVGAERISLLITKPLGAKSVLNLLPARGGADPENESQARANIPTALHALDRLVSVRDYADFSRTFAGIAKASARALPGGALPLVHVTIACDGDIELDPTTELFRNLLAALQRFGDPYQQVKIEMRERLIAMLSARIRIDPAYLWDKVEPAVRAALLEHFGFDRRALGQSLFGSEIVAVLQSVPGVAFVDLDTLRAIAAKDVLPNWSTKTTIFGVINTGTFFSKSTEDTPAKHVKIAAELAHVDDKNQLRPAQLAYLTPEVPATVILQEIKE